MNPVLRCLGSSPTSTPLQVATYTIRSVQLESFLLDMYLAIRLNFAPVTFETLSPSHSPPTCAFSSPPRVFKSQYIYHPLYPEKPTPRPFTIRCSVSKRTIDDGCAIPPVLALSSSNIPRASESCPSACGPPPSPQHVPSSQMDDDRTLEGEYAHTIQFRGPPNMPARISAPKSTLRWGRREDVCTDTEWMKKR
ncbi:hypothetical protein Hypma_014403 [Hypsizygus marmoreus]|uniref:Uncharacterized protein n=1 Tax=Hypsizygus marmoreus TaxID=39966 RepID=A0A369JCV8_HYPMA|nr:hypothetical protein Hypma_014403 [Hypsizygus marmoreus]